MEYSYSQGELGEIVRASGVKQAPPHDSNPDSSWPFPSSDLMMDLHQEEMTDYDCFGNNPFVLGTPRDTNNELLQEICMPTSFFISNSHNIRTNSAAASDPPINATSSAAREDAKDGGFCNEDQSGGRVDDDGILAGMLRISSSNNTAKANHKSFDTTYGGSAVSSPSQREIVKQAPFLAGNMIIHEGSSARISSNQTQSSYAKRRKKEAKKVICIPAPPSNGKSSGEVVPPDLWAWRKYGQKPIKGSPYPRGYYRCSSSKGCPARKQVEKSRNDPNMLVVTYTCEHNHAWPTQRNALAGSTRAQPNVPSRSNAASSNPKNSPSTSNSQVENDLNNQESIKQAINVKEEERRTVGTGQQMNMDEAEFNDDGGYRIQVSDQMQMATESNRFSEDFFAELGEIESTSIDDLLLNPGKSTGDNRNECKAIDPIFSFLDWSSGT